MLKKILFLGASVALALTATTASAGTPAFTVMPLTGSVKIIGSDGSQDGSSKIFKVTGNAKTIIRLALGNEPDAPVENEKNLVLGLANPNSEQSCAAEVVVWDKTGNEGLGAIVGEVVAFSNCSDDNTISSGPAEGKNGTYKEAFTLKAKFIGSGDNSCGSLDNSLLSGGGAALGEYSEKITSNGNVPPTPIGLTVTGLIGDLYTVEDEHLVITGGSFKANLTPTKALGTSSAPLYIGCD